VQLIIVIIRYAQDEAGRLGRRVVGDTGRKSRKLIRACMLCVSNNSPA
jgi:hypothetical protein